MDDQIVTSGVAVVYHAAGRRYLTKRAAFQAVARSIIRSRCYCERGVFLTPGSTCHYHAPEHYDALVTRLARWLNRSSPPAEPTL